MSLLLRLGLLLALLTAPWAASSARADQAGDFDYYVLALSWSPQYCAGSQRGDDLQCRRPYAFVVHGLWPQHERGWPERCGKASYVPQAVIDDMLPIMPSKGLILHQWRKHGVCSGLSAERYFALTRQAANRVQIPKKYQALSDYLQVNMRELEADFLRVNRQFSADGIALQCGGRYFKELRFCFTRDLTPRACSDEVRDACPTSTVLRPVR